MHARVRERVREPEQGDEGFMLLAAIVMVFLVLLALSVAAPTIAKQIQRDREVESKHRAEQYVRAVRIFYIKYKRYPTSIEQLEKTNNIRFLRQRYVDPLTGKDDYRIIHQGQNQTTVKGFFGEDLPGLPTGLGSAAGLQSTSTGSTTGPTGTGFGGSSSFGTPIGGGSGAGTTNGLGANAGTGAGAGSTAASTAGAAGTGTTPAPGTTGANTGTNGVGQDATSFTGSGGGPIIGVGSSKIGEAMLVVNEQNQYEAWEFLYDPRIEQLYAKATLLGGISSGSGTSGFGSGTNTNAFPPPPGAAPAQNNSNGQPATPPPSVGLPILQ